MILSVDVELGGVRNDNQEVQNQPMDLESEDKEKVQEASLVEPIAKEKVIQGPKPNICYKDYVSYAFSVIEDGIPTILKKLDMSS